MKGGVVLRWLQAGKEALAGCGTLQARSTLYKEQGKWQTEDKDDAAALETTSSLGWNRANTTDSQPSVIR